MASRSQSNQLSWEYISAISFGDQMGNRSIVAATRALCVGLISLIALYIQGRNKPESRMLSPDGFVSDSWYCEGIIVRGVLNFGMSRIVFVGEGSGDACSGCFVWLMMSIHDIFRNLRLGTQTHHDRFSGGLRVFGSRQMRRISPVI